MLENSILKRVWVHTRIVCIPQASPPNQRPVVASPGYVKLCALQYRSHLLLQRFETKLAMGTRGLVGFITKGVRKGAYNQYDSYPSHLGNSIIRFILAHTGEELEEMRLKVEQASAQSVAKTDDQLQWIRSEQVELLMHNESSLAKIHFPTNPTTTRGCYNCPSSDPPDVQIRAFRAQNLDFPQDITDEEILARYILTHFPFNVSCVLQRLCWIPEHGEVIEAFDQVQLLDRIWDGRQEYIVDQTTFV
jgi:hypothetical protein